MIPHPCTQFAQMNILTDSLINTSVNVDQEQNHVQYLVTIHIPSARVYKYENEIFDTVILP